MVSNRIKRLVCLPITVAIMLSLSCAAPSAPPTPTPAPAPAKPVPTTAPAKPAPAPTVAPAKPAPTAAPAKPASKPAEKPLADVTMRFSFGPSGTQAAYYAALEYGFYRNAGLNVRLMDGTGSATAAQSVGSGNDTFGEADAGTVINFVHQGLPIKTFATVVQRSPMAICSLAETGIAKPKDLEGKRLGQSAESAATVIFPAFAAANGLDMDKITNINMPIPATLTALSEKRIEATTCFLTSLLVPLEARGFKVSALSYADYGVNTLNIGLFTTQTIIQQKPDMVRGFAAATLKGWEEARKNPDEAIKAFLKHKPEVQQNIALGQLKIFADSLHTPRTQGKPIGFGDKQDWEDTVSVLLKTGMIKERRPVDQYYTNDFLQ